MLTFHLSETTTPNLWAETAFRNVISDYQEIRTSLGTMKATTYDRGNEAGKVTNAGRSCLIRPLDVDYVCEIEIAARRVLTRHELDYFHLFYKSCAVVVLRPCDLEEHDFDASLDAHYVSMYEEDRDAVAAMDLEVRRKLGARLIEVGIFGYSDYKSPSDTSGRTLSDGSRPRRSLLRPPATKKEIHKKNS